MASVGATGINLHGGGSGLYTPIAGSMGQGFTARPDYYGLLFARPLQDATMLSSELNARGENITAYALQRDGKVTVLTFNKSEKPTTLAISLPAGHSGSGARILRLTAPAVDATDGDLLGGSPVGRDGVWNPKSQETIAKTGGKLLLPIPVYSAASVHFA